MLSLRRYTKIQRFDGQQLRELVSVLVLSLG
jgi:hypothetical protein